VAALREGAETLRGQQRASFELEKLLAALATTADQVGSMTYVTCITIIDIIILTNYTNDAYYVICHMS
jgi:hypothetical protein